MIATYLIQRYLNGAEKYSLDYPITLGGRAIFGRFQTTSQNFYDDIDVCATVELIVESEPKLESFMEHLDDMKTVESRVYLLYARTLHMFFALAIKEMLTNKTITEPPKKL
ncbi:glutamate [NMDA] receptor subunit 1-like isoform 1-T1 [Glossina fuscipes fuscipes]